MLVDRENLSVPNWEGLPAPHLPTQNPYTDTDPHILSTPGSPTAGGTNTHTPSFNCPALSSTPHPRPVISLISTIGSRVLSHQDRHGNILRTVPGNTSGNTHSFGRDAGCFEKAQPRTRKEIKPERRPPSFLRSWSW